MRAGDSLLGACVTGALDLSLQVIGFLGPVTDGRTGGHLQPIQIVGCCMPILLRVLAFTSPWGTRLSVSHYTVRQSAYIPTVVVAGTPSQW